MMFTLNFTNNLSSNFIGWVAVTPFKDDICDIQAWTPESRGIYIRSPPVLPYAINQRGPRIKYTPTYYPLRE